MIKMWFKLLLAIIFSCCAFGSSDLFKISENVGDSVAPFIDPLDGINYRLPNDTIPLRYEIWLSTDIDRGYFAFQGRIAITIQALQSTSEITMHFRRLEILNVRLLRGTGGSIQSNVSFYTRPEVEFLIITPAQNLFEGMTYQVIITYNGELNIDKKGLYLASYIDSSNTLIWMAATNFKSTDARQAFPW